MLGNTVHQKATQLKSKGGVIENEMKHLKNHLLYCIHTSDVSSRIIYS